jgi:hypothetical protein
MDLFLVGFSHPAATHSSGEFAVDLATYGHGAELIRDWASLTPDDTRWGVVIDVPDAASIRGAAEELGFEIAGMVRLVPDAAVPQPGGDWAQAMSEVLPNEPPPTLGPSIFGGVGESGPYMALPPDVKACAVCGWIGDHDPNVDHPSSP